MPVGNVVGIESHCPHFLESFTIVLVVDGVGQEELGTALRCVDLERNGDGRSEKNSVLSFLGDDE